MHGQQNIKTINKPKMLFSRQTYAVRGPKPTETAPRGLCVA